MSARNVAAALDRQQYDVVLVYINRTGSWWLVDDVDVHENPTQELMPLLGQSSFRVLPSQDVLQIDVLLPILHGENGEDGSIQALAQLMHVPVVGCDMPGSVVCIQKHLTKKQLQQAGLPVTPYRVLYREQSRPYYTDIAQELGDTLFVKPSSLGSSIGISKVADAAQFDVALDLAFGYDRVVVVEAAVQARELEVALLERDDKVMASCVGEVIPDRAFYDYDSKYDDDSKTQAVIPAKIDGTVTSQIQDFARQAFRDLGCRGMARFDFFLDPEGKLYINEVNTIPGFTNISMYPKLWEASGIPNTMLLSTLIQQAIARD